MSMLSAQCDDLRKTADELQVFIDNAHNYTWSGFFSTLHYAQQELRGAADTIWELRNNLVGVVGQSDEIDRLKEQVRWLKKGDVLHVLTDQELVDQQKHEREMRASITALDDENAKLRELLEAILQCVGETKRDKGCDACPMFNGDEAGAYLNKNWCLLRPTMCELGIEVADA